MSSIIKNINTSIVINAPKEKLFQIISNHVGTPDWVAEVKEVLLLKEGKPQNGVGAIREVNFKPAFWTTVQERIVAYEANVGFQYKVIAMPGLVDHLGVWALTEDPNGHTTVSWSVRMEFKKFHWFSLLVNKFERDFKKVQVNALTGLKKSMETA